MNRFLDVNAGSSQKDCDQLDDARRSVGKSKLKRYRITAKATVIETTAPERWRSYFIGDKSFKIEEI